MIKRLAGNRQGSHAFCVVIVTFNFTLSNALCEESPIQGRAPSSPTSVIGASPPRYIEEGFAPLGEKPSALPQVIDVIGADEVKEYLWSVYQRSSTKRDSHGDFTWKDASAAARLGLSAKDFVIGGMDADFREQLFAVGHAMDAAGIEWTILSAFRDDYRQSLATGFRAQVGTSFHGGSIATGGYGRGCAVDVASADGVSNDTVWTWIDLHGRQFGLERPMARIDPAHVQPRARWHELAATLRNQRVEIPAVRGTNPASDVGAIYPSSTREPSTASLLEEQFTCVGSRLAGEFNKGQGLVHRLTRIMHHMERFLHVW